MNQKLSVHLVAWNGAKYIPCLFDSLRRQTFKDWSLLIVDNNSADNTVEAIKKELADFPVPYELVENKENKGFAGGHNQAFRATDAEYFLLLNQDMYLAPDCLEKMVEFLDGHPDTAAVSPRLMKWDFVSACHSTDVRRGNPAPNDLNDALDSRFSSQGGPAFGGRGNDSCTLGMTNVIDALGLKIFKNRRVIEWMTQEEWPLINQQFNNFRPKADPPLAETIQQFVVEVFGVSGAFPMYRRAMIQEVIFDDGNFFDESYHSYKEDVDLAYRLASRGFKSYVLLDTVAYHDRAGAGPKEMDDQSAAANKKKQSEWVKYHSYKNHLMTLYKNEYWQNFILDFPWILWYELKKFSYFLLFNRKVLAGLKEIWRTRADLAKKRRQVKKMRKVNWGEMRRWWS